MLRKQLFALWLNLNSRPRNCEKRSFICVLVSNACYCLLIMTMSVGRKPVLHNVAGKSDFTLHAIGRTISQITHLRFLCMAALDQLGGGGGHISPCAKWWWQNVIYMNAVRMVWVYRRHSGSVIWLICFFRDRFKPCADSVRFMVFP